MEHNALTLQNFKLTLFSNDRSSAYCGGSLCGSYPNFVENMYEQGIIKAPVISFYQLANGDSVPSGVTSQVAVGGVDRNKYTGSMDWYVEYLFELSLRKLRLISYWTIGSLSLRTRCGSSLDRNATSAEVTAPHKLTSHLNSLAPKSHSTPVTQVFLVSRPKTGERL